MTRDLLNEIENDYWNEKADPIDMAEVFDLANRALEKPCDDCISRSDILDAIKTWDKFGINAEQKLIRWQDHYVPYVHLDDVRNAIANMPSVTPQQTRWIPVSEELPEENIHFLCQFYMGGMAECYHAHGVWHIVGGYRISCDEVVAWMPLPEPYKAESKIEQTLAYADQDTLMSAT